MRLLLTLAAGLDLMILPGCAAKHQLAPALTSPVQVLYRRENCKPLPNFQPGLVCDKVKLIPLTLPVNNK